MLLRRIGTTAGVSRLLSTVLGIETSCDDTAVAIVRSDGHVLSSASFADRETQTRLGGIIPAHSAQQHRALLPRLVEECLASARVRLGDMDVISVSTRPGMVVALKEGARHAVHLARSSRRPLLLVHHMRAHALVSTLVHKDIRFPFLALLISGGHSLIVVVYSSERFEVLGRSDSGNAGECFDKIGRNLLRLDQVNVHPGAELERKAKGCSTNGHLRYAVGGVSSSGSTNFNFSGLRSALIQALRRNRSDLDFSEEDFAATTQHHIARHLCTRLHAALCFLREGALVEEEGSPPMRDLVVAGGVAANRYLFSCIRKVCDVHSLRARSLPPSLCTDNAVMIAWTALLMMEQGTSDMILPHELPPSLYVHARAEIGKDRTGEVPRQQRTLLKRSSIHDGPEPLKLHHKDNYRRLAAEGQLIGG